ncbi:MAG: hypothetical protein QY305_03925 [Candidatus Brocadiaceae baterium WH-1]|nr:MAG: hypothetical protein QY305_03925 [Candidatus Jettenia sp. AMX2]
MRKLKDTGISALLHGHLFTGIKQNAYLDKIFETKPTTFNEFKLAINSLLEFASTSTLSKNENLASDYFKIESKRLKKKLAA